MLTLNTTEYEWRLAREALLYGSIDAKRPTAWVQYGYPEQLLFEQLKQAYDRGGAGFGAVHRILDKCWQERPRIKKLDDAGAAAKKKPKPMQANAQVKKKRERSTDEPTPWEEKVDELLRSIQAFKKLRDFDRRNMVGHYAALIYRVADSQPLDQPLKRATKLVDLVPLFENQIKVTAWHSDPVDAENFGKPRMFQYRTHVPGSQTDKQGRPEQWVDVHPSRVQILAEGSVGDFLEGVPLLRAGFNHLVDLEKIAGGSAEGFLKNSARTLVVKFDAEASPQVITQNPDGSSSGKSVKTVIEENAKKLNSNVDASIVLQGGDAQTLQTQMPDPKPSFEVAANLFAASVRIPFTILFGQQTGRLASDEDQTDMNARCEARQDNELTPMLEEFVKRMQACGLIEQSEFEVEWPPLDAPADDEKLDQAAKMAAINKEGQAGGLTEPVFDTNEIRRVAGYDERDDDGMPDPADEAADAEAQRQHELALRGLDPSGKPIVKPTAPRAPGLRAAA